MNASRLLIGFSHRVVYAVCLSAFVWYLTIVPFAMIPLGRSSHVILAQVLDFPVAVVSTVLPAQLKGIDLWSSERQPERANMWELLYAQLRVGVPVYVVLFYVPNWTALLRRRWSERTRRA